jgi:hypothetical protein
MSAGSAWLSFSFPVLYCAELSLSVCAVEIFEAPFRTGLFFADTAAAPTKFFLAKEISRLSMPGLSV